MARRLAGQKHDGHATLATTRFLARTLWFVSIDKWLIAVTLIMMAGIVVAGVFYTQDAPVGSILSLIVAASGLVTWVADWLRRANHSDMTRSFPNGHLANFSYRDRTYADWRIVSTKAHPGQAATVVTNLQLNARLRNEEQIAIRYAGHWLPDDPRVNYVRKLWGGGAGRRNEGKIRLSTDLLPESTSVDLQSTDYNSYVVTNNLCVEKIQLFDQSELSIRHFDFAHNKLPDLRHSPLSNHLGGDVLALEPGGFWLQLNSRNNKVFPLQWSASASGSFDSDIELNSAADLVGLVKLGLIRELTEEMGLPEGSVAESDMIILGYSRASYMAGKPQFYGLARSRHMVPGGLEEHTARRVRLSFDLDDGIPGIIAAYEKFMQDQSHPISPPLATLMQFLTDWTILDRPQATEWISHYWD